jgi:hypothetical protein
MCPNNSYEIEWKKELFMNFTLLIDQMLDNSNRITQAMSEVDDTYFNGIKQSKNY